MTSGSRIVVQAAPTKTVWFRAPGVKTTPNAERERFVVLLRHRPWAWRTRRRVFVGMTNAHQAWSNAEHRMTCVGYVFVSLVVRTVFAARAPSTDATASAREPVIRGQQDAPRMEIVRPTSAACRRQACSLGMTPKRTCASRKTASTLQWPRLSAVLTVHAAEQFARAHIHPALGWSAAVIPTLVNLVERVQMAHCAILRTSAPFRRSAFRRPRRSRLPMR